MENLLSQQGKAVEKKHSKAWTMEEVEVLYHRHIETVYGVCFALMGKRCDAEDAAGRIPQANAESNRFLQRRTREGMADYHRPKSMQGYPPAVVAPKDDGAFGSSPRSFRRHI